MSRIFISYKRVDKDKVFKIKDQIESALGEKCWIDIDGIESDKQFVNVIIKAIDNAEIVLFMYSHQHSLIKDIDNDWTIRELDYANDEKKRIVFVNIDQSPLEGWFKFMYGKKQQVDATSKSAIQKLCLDLEAWLYPDRILEKEVLQHNIEAVAREKFREENLKILKEESERKLRDKSITDAMCVDLGLPSGTKWATCNLGATSPEEIGDYFAWGETTPKDIYSNSSYKFYKEIRDTNPKTGFTSLSWRKEKYNDMDGLTQLELEDDAAYVNLGDFWRVPSEEQFTELKNACEWKWMEIKGQTGYKITGRNGNSIFLPTNTGGMDDRGKSLESHFYYWTRSMPTRDPIVFSEECGGIYLYPVHPDEGYQIRPVYEDPKTKGLISRLVRFIKYI